MSRERPYYSVAAATVADVWECSDCGTLVHGLAGQVKHDRWHSDLETLVRTAVADALGELGTMVLH